MNTMLRKALHQLNVIFRKLIGCEGAIKFFQRKLTVSELACNWREENSVIYLSVKSNGTTVSQWIECLKGRGYPFTSSEEVFRVLRSSHFKPTSGVTTEIVILKSSYFNDSDRTTKKIRDDASKCGLMEPNTEVAHLILETFTDQGVEALGLSWIVVMHEPIKNSEGGYQLLCVRRDNFGRWIEVRDGRSDKRWGRGFGFAFIKPQVGINSDTLQ